MPASSQHGEVASIVLGIGQVKDISVSIHGNGKVSCGLAMIIYGEVKKTFAKRQDLEFTRLIILSDFTGEVGENPEPDTDVLELVNISNVQVSVEYAEAWGIGRETVQGIPTGRTTISLTVYGMPESYSNFMYRKMK